MERSSRRPQRSSSWGRRVPSALVLALVLVTCVLILPAPASAVVDKSHARVYAATVSVLSRREKTHQQLYNAYADQMISVATDMEPIVNSLDPDDQATVATLQVVAGHAYERYTTSLKKVNSIYLSYVKSFYRAHQSWFSHEADKIRLEKWTTKYTNGLRSTNAAFAKLADANMALSDKDVPTARSCNNDAIKLILKGDPLIKQALDGLRALRR
jgi:hypothetical protein